MPRLCCGSIRTVACLHIYTDHVCHVYSLHSRIHKPFQTTCMTSEHNLQQNSHRKGNESLQYVVTLGPKVDLSVEQSCLLHSGSCPAAAQGLPCGILSEVHISRLCHSRLPSTRVLLHCVS